MKALISTLCFLTCFGFSVETGDSITLKQLEALYSNPSKDITIVNFWASWCGPCVREIPMLDKIGSKPEIDLFFVSLDFKQDIEKANKIILKKKVQSNNYFLDEGDPDKMIRAIEESWTGAIPATLFIHKSGKRIFHEAELTEEEIDTILLDLKTS